MSTPHSDIDRLARKYFDEALDIKDPATRQEFLELACTDNPSLLNAIMSLLDSWAQLDDPIDQSHELVGQNIGEYFIEGEIGRGGMGTVYLGRSTESQREVAIKVISRGFVSPDGKRRFAKEMQIMNRLDHPNLAKLITAGRTPQGLPYVVMEYIEGQRIDAYCDRNKLTIRERLELFGKVCAVVSYAHANEVIHRDIKPNNIMVTAAGEPKLIDFGIAKVIKTELEAGAYDPTTLVQQRAFSIDYASPEQVRGDKTIGRTTDVYSLGVVLYELLTGHRAHRFKGKHHGDEEIRKVICETDVTRPSLVIDIEVKDPRRDNGSSLTTETVGDLRNCQPWELRRLLKGNLDSILLKALCKAPEQRYQSIREFSDDIANHLNGRPVKARKGAWRKKFNKLAHRLDENLPPTSFGFKTKLLAYSLVLIVFLFALNFEKIKKKLETTPHIDDSSIWASLRKSQQTKLVSAIDKMSADIVKEINQDLIRKEPWEASQMVLSTRGLVAFDETQAVTYLRDNLKNKSYYEFLGNGHFAASEWALLAINKLGAEKTPEQINFLLDRGNVGWWPLYRSTLYSNTEKYASTYATAYAVLSLHEHLESQLNASSDKDRLRFAIDNGQRWLLKNHVPGKAIWCNNPDCRQQSIGLSGLVMHVLHRTHAADKYGLEMEKLDDWWRQEVLPYRKDHKDQEDYEKSDPYGDGKQNAKNISIPWAIIATSDTYSGGTTQEKEAAIRWTNSVIDNLDSNLDVSGYYIKAEWLIALRYLRGDKVM